MTFDWDRIRVFVAVVDHGSLSAAARMLGMSQPTAGRYIQQLEADLDLLLFARTGRQLALTEAGLALVEHARAMADAAGRLAVTAAGRETSVAGVVRITASEIVATYWLPRLLVALRQQEPQIEIELVASNSTDNLLAREADIAVRMYRPTQAEVITKHIRDLELGAFAAERYLARRGEPKSAEDLLEHDVAGFDRDETIIQGFRSFGYDVPRRFFPLRTDDQVVLWRAVVEGYGIGFMPVALGVAEPRVRRILPGLPLPVLPMWLTAHAELRTNRRIRRVFDFLAAALGEDVEVGR